MITRQELDPLGTGQVLRGLMVQAQIGLRVNTIEVYDIYACCRESF